MAPPSGELARERLRGRLWALPHTLHFSRKPCRHAKGPISEDDFPRPGEDVTEGDKKGNLSPKATGGVRSNPPPVKMRLERSAECDKREI